MSLAATVRKGVDTAFAAVGDLKSTVVVKRVVSEQYVPSTGQTTRLYEQVSVEGVLLNFQKTQIEVGSAGVSVAIPSEKSRKLLLKVSDMPFVPTENDIVDISDLSYEVNGVNIDPSNSVYTLFLRKV